MPRKGIAETEKVGLPPLSMPDGVRLGAHLSIAGGTCNSLVRARALGCTAVQLFVKNANQWAGKPLGSDEGARFRAEWESAGRPVCFAHNSYLTNLASASDALWEKSIAALADEVRRCAALGLPGIVVHPGAAGEQSEREAIVRVGAGLTEVFRRTSDVGVEVWLETTAGQGSSLGWRFEQLAAILESARLASRLGFCLDTCHVFAAGYDIATRRGYRDTMKEWERVIGWERLRAIHVNDSKGERGSRLDRHHHIGQGRIGREGFCRIMNDDLLRGVPKVIETPKGARGEKDWENLRALLGCLKKGRH